MKRIGTIFAGAAAALALAGACAAPAAAAPRFNDKVENRPYADLRRWHLGFSVGMHVQDLTFTHPGFVTDGGQAWYVEQPSFSPGFCVTGLFDYRLSGHFNVRLSPGLYFGNRNVRMRDVTSDQELRQDIKSTYLVLPVDIKYSGQRYRNSRPYITAGVMPAFDVAKKPSDYIKLKANDVYLTVGLGCDFYLPYFKFIPDIKFCFGLSNLLVKDRPDLSEQPQMMDITKSLSKAASKMFVFTFYFE